MANDRFIPRIDGYAIDCIVSETHTMTGSVSAFPVESNGRASDHIAIAPRTLSVEGIVSDSPIGAIEIERAGLADPSAVSTLSSDVAFVVLENSFEMKEPITIETSTRTYTNMAWTSFVVTRDKDTGAALRFSATFEEMIIRDTKRTTIVVRADARAAPKKKMGTMSAEARAKFDAEANALKAKVEKENADYIYSDENRKNKYTPLPRSRVGEDGYYQPKGVGADYVDESGHLHPGLTEEQMAHQRKAVIVEKLMADEPWWSPVLGIPDSWWE